MPDYKFKEFPCTCDLSSPILCEGCLSYIESESIPLFMLVEKEEC